MSAVKEKKKRLHDEEADVEQLRREIYETWRHWPEPVISL